MRENKIFKRLVIFAIAAFMCLSTASIVSAEFFDFEDDDGGWVPTADWDPVGDWEWTDNYDVSNYVGDNTPPPSAYSGDGLWGTVIYDDYTNSGGETWLSQTFDFSSVAPADAVLSFYSWEDAFGSWDYCYVNVNGNEEYYSEDYSPTAWKYVEVDLSAYAGLSSVEITFGMHASTVVNYAGWYIDDVAVAGEAPEPNNGDTCDSAIEVEIPADLDYTTSDTTCDLNDDYYDTDLGSYDGGNDIIYKLEVTTDSTIIVDVTADTYYVGAGLFDDCPDIGTMVASDTGGDLNFNYDCLAAESPYYLMIDTWPSPDCTDFDLTISAPKDDVGVSDIIRPVDGDGTDPVPVSVDVTNYGSEDETSVPVHVTIEQELGGGVLLDEGFEGTFPPTGWTIETYDGTTYEWEQWAYDDTTYSYEPPGTGDYYAVAQDDETPTGTDVNTGLFTPSMDMTGLNSVNVDFEHCFQDFAGYGEAEMRTYSGGVLEEVLLSETTDGGYSGEHISVNFDPSGYADPSDVQIEAWYTDDYYDSGAWGLAIDDVVVEAPTSYVTVYNQTVNIDILVGETITVDTFPDWTGMTAGKYNVQACTELGIDADNSNDCMEKLGVKIGYLDAGVTAINHPQPLMGPVPFSPNATVENFGDLDLDSVPVHAWIEGGEELKFQETFESAAGFTYSDLEVAAESDFDTHTGEGVVKIVGEKQDMQAFSDWLVIDMDGDGTTWHQTDYKSCEGTYSAYSGVEGVGYQSSSYDWLISPAIDVGSGGRIEVDIDYDIETYWDHLYIGNSADGSLFYIQNYDGNSGGCTTISQDLNPSGISAGGTTYICFILNSDSIFNYEGAYVDNVKVYGGGIVYDKTVNVDIPVGSPVDVEFPEFNPPDAADYTLNVCTEYAVDENTANDCQDLAFTTDAPVYIKETGIGFTTIQPAINAAEPGQTVVVTDGRYNEDLIIDKPITVTAENIESTLDSTHCTYTHEHGSFIEGTVDIKGSEMVDQPEPSDCEYEICLEDDFGDGWNGGSLDVVVDGTVVLNDITLTSGSGPECFTFTVSDGSSIEVLYTPGSWAYENFFSVYDSEGNTVVANYYPDTSGDWSGTATCPQSSGVAMDTVFENFDVNPFTTFNDHEAAILVTGDNVIVRKNTIHNVRGLCEDSSFTIKGIHVYGGDSENPMNGIVIENNTVRDILNENVTGNGGGGGTGEWELLKSYFLPGTSPETWYTESIDLSSYAGTDAQFAWRYLSDYEWGCYVDDVSVGSISEDFEGTIGTLPLGWTQQNDGTACGSTYHYWEQSTYKSNTGAQSAECRYNCPNDDWLISPVTTLGTGETLDFAYLWDDSWDIEMEVYIKATGGGGGAPTSSCYGGATGIMVQGFIDDIQVMNNKIMDIQSVGWCYGIEYTPTNLPSLSGSGSFAECEYEVCLIDTWGDGWDIGYGGPNTLDIIVDGEVVLDDIYLSDGTGPECYTFTVSDGSTIEADYTGIGSYQSENEYIIYDYKGDVVTHQGAGGAIPGDWTGTGDCGGEEEPEKPIIINCNYFNDIGVGTDYDVWNNTAEAPYPGIMLTVDEAEIPGPANADLVTLKCNYFDPGCYKPAYAVINKDLENPLNAAHNYWGAPDGPNSDPYNGYVQDPISGYTANGLGAEIVNYGQVIFDPWLGISARGPVPPDPVNPTSNTRKIKAMVGEPVEFNGGDSFAFCFDGCEECCNHIEQPLQFLWDFDDEFYSSDSIAYHVYEQPGTYHVSLMVDAAGFKYYPNFMYDWLYFNVTIEEEGQPLSANADGENLGVYEGMVGEEIQFYGSGSGGTGKYMYEWDFGDGTTSNLQNPTHVYENKEGGVYTATLTVTDWESNQATDTSEVIVHNIEELFVSINGQSNVAVGDSIKFTSTVAGGRSPYDYNWNFGDGVASNEINPLHIFESSGTYTVSLTVTDSMGDTETKTKTVTVKSTNTNGAQIEEVKGGFGIKATIDSGDSECCWDITVDGKYVLMGGENNGTIQANKVETARLGFSLAIGKVNVTVKAANIEKDYTAFAIGPFYLNLKEI